MSARHIAEAFPVGVFIVEEMQARGWSVRDLARRMGGDSHTNELGLGIMILVPTKGVLLGNIIARRLAHAFGTFADLWLNLDRSWQEAQ